MEPYFARNNPPRVRPSVRAPLCTSVSFMAWHRNRKFRYLFPDLNLGPVNDAGTTVPQDSRRCPIAAPRIEPVAREHLQAATEQSLKAVLAPGHYLRRHFFPGHSGRHLKMPCNVTA